MFMRHTPPNPHKETENIYVREIDERKKVFFLSTRFSLSVLFGGEEGKEEGVEERLTIRKWSRTEGARKKKSINQSNKEKRKKGKGKKKRKPESKSRERERRTEMIVIDQAERTKTLIKHIASQTLCIVGLRNIKRKRGRWRRRR